MKKHLLNIGGIMLFYSLIVIGVIILNLRFTYLNELNISNTAITMKN